MTEALQRKAHADINMPIRAFKARKIELLLGLDGGAGGSLLEVGTGSGGIAHYFAHHPRVRWDVSAVDVTDNRQLSDGYRFELITGCGLPFPSQSIDVVISNHVIEHVGDRASQLRHLQEMLRVLKPGGIGYLAVPNRWMLVEPHYRLAFLSWLPHGWRTPYLRMRRKGEVYDCEPLELDDLESLLEESGFGYRNIGASAVRAIFAIERPHSLPSRVMARVPDAIVTMFRRIIPTLIYEIRRPREDGAGQSSGPAHD